MYPFCAEVELKLDYKSTTIVRHLGGGYVTLQNKSLYFDSISKSKRNLVLKTGMKTENFLIFKDAIFPNNLV